MTATNELQSSASESVTLSILIVSFNVRDRLHACLASIGEPDGVEIIVVDNGSTDGSAEMVRRLFPRHVLDAQPKNLGFGKAVNNAALLARGSVYLLLNPDTELPAGALHAMQNYFFERPEVAVMGFRQVDGEGHVQLVAGRRPTLWREFLRRRLQRRIDVGPGVRAGSAFDAHRAAVEVDWVSASVMMVGAQAFEAVGGFDDSFFLYFEDVDFCLRQSRRGACVVYEPRTTVVHHRGASSEGIRSSVLRTYRCSQLTFARRYFDRLSLFLFECYLRIHRNHPEH